MNNSHRLTAGQVEFFHDEGYLMVPDVYGHEELEAFRAEISAVVAMTADGYNGEGRIESTHANAGFDRQMALLVDDHPDLMAALCKAIEGKAGGGHCGPEMFRALTNPALLDVIEDIVGPEIVASSVYRIRPKLPKVARGVVPWHQDSGYFAPHCDHDLIVTAWVPLIDATIETGCLWVLPRAHHGGVVAHRTGGNAGFLVISDQDLPAPIDGSIPVPVPMGGALLLTNLTPHCSKSNDSDIVRWSIDLRYQGASVPTNARQQPEDFCADAEPINIACYPPEGDFIVRSRRNPAKVVGYETFVERRRRFDEAEIPYPDRHWASFER